MIKNIIFAMVMFITILNANNDRALKRYIQEYGDEKKLALVVGNSNYNNKNLSKLKNPINDARAVRDKLKQKDFEVLYIENATQRELDKMLKRFNSKLNKSKVGLFYFAGHGLEVKKKNYLIPLGANISDEMDVKYEAIAVDEIVERMKDSGTRLNLVILDACRNNPFKRGSGGLAPMPNAKGTLIAYSTASGSTASDNPREKNGLFTKYFLKVLDEPLNQREFFHKIRMKVYEASENSQLPYLNDGTIGDFFFTLDAGKNSSYNFSNEVSNSFSLTINQTPYDAKIQILNIKPKYYDGIKLKKGNYKIKVSKSGYISKKGTIELKSNTTIAVTLDKEKSYTSSTVTPTSVGNNIWKDSATGLTWQDEKYTKEDKKHYDENTEGGKVSDWNGAKNYCRKLSLGGYNDWRLPTKKELKTLLTKNSSKSSNGYSYYIKKHFLKYMPPLNGKYKSAVFWSSTKHEKYSSNAWVVDFDYGNDNYFNISNSYFVRCVR